MAPSEFPHLARLLWVGPLTIAACVAAVLAVRLVAVGLLHPAPSFQPLLYPPPIIDTVVGVSAAIFVFTNLVILSPTPIRTFRIVAGAVLLVSFWPDVVLARSHWFGGGWPEAFALMSMHVIAWAVCVTMLTTLTLVKTDG